MKYNFSDIALGSQVTLFLSNSSAHMNMNATIEKFLRDDIAIITLETNINRVLNFNNVQIKFLYTSPKGLPYQWQNAQITYLKNKYLLIVTGEGVRYNRRVAFRVGISHPAQLITADGRKSQTTVKDISLTGFSITDHTKALPLKMDSSATLIFEDIGHEINLLGNVLRIEEREDAIIYGFGIMRSCKDLDSYVTFKQRRKRNGM